MMDQALVKYQSSLYEHLRAATRMFCREGG